MMRIAISMLLLVLVYVLPMKAEAKAPDWHRDRSLQGERYEVIGYGQGSDEVKAKDNAILEIARAVGVVRVRRETKKESKDRDVTWKQDAYIDEEAQIGGVTTIRLEKKGRQFYTAVKYDNSTALEKVLRVFKKGDCGHDFLYDSSGFDSLTYFSRQIQEKLQCAPIWSLEYKNFNWFLDVTTPENQHQRHWIKKDEFKNHMPDEGSENLKVRSSKESVEENSEGFYLVIDNNRSGWLYLFNVTHEGQSLLMESFGWKVPGKGRQYPANDMVLKAELPREWNDPSAREYYLAVLCPREADFREHRISQEVPDRDDPDTYGYGRLLRDIRRGNCDVAGSSLIVHREKK